MRLKVDRASRHRVDREARRDDEILPVLWEDNYFALLPGETRHVTATYHARDAGKARPSVQIEGWNVNRGVVASQ